MCDALQSTYSLFIFFFFFSYLINSFSYHLKSKMYDKNKQICNKQKYNNNS